jgi:nucleoside-diphosphate-sugar epimerase
MPEGGGWRLGYSVRIADLTDLGDAMGALRDADAVIHLAAIPWAGR